MVGSDAVEPFRKEATADNDVSKDSLRSSPEHSRTHREEPLTSFVRPRKALGTLDAVLQDILAMLG